MRRVYLIRHGMPDFPSDERFCLGLTDMPLGSLGRLQGCMLGRELGAAVSCVFSSRLRRALDTASFIAPPVILTGLEEMSAGDWDGLSFSEIKKGWPELFARRGREPGLAIPGAEDVHAGQSRFMAAVARALEQSRGDVAIVAHSTVIQSFISAVLGTPVERCRQYCLPYGSYSVFDYDGAFYMQELGALPRPELDGGLCLALLEAAGCGDNIKKHCLAVAAEAGRIAGELGRAGLELDLKLIRSAALLHDIARRESGHEEKGAEWVRELGYGQLAPLISQHHDLESVELGEAAVLFIADKLVREDAPVSLAERFSQSAVKCRTAEAREAHQRRYEAALAVKDRINSLCGKDVII